MSMNEWFMCDGQQMVSNPFLPLEPPFSPCFLSIWPLFALSHSLSLSLSTHARTHIHARTHPRTHARTLYMDVCVWPQIGFFPNNGYHYNAVKYNTKLCSVVKKIRTLTRFWSHKRRPISRPRRRTIWWLLRLIKKIVKRYNDPAL